MSANTTAPVLPVPPVPGWLVTGARVGVLNHGTGRMTARLETVARFTKTRVVLADGLWFPLDRLHRHDDSYRRTDLVPRSDPALVRALQAQAVDRATERIRRSRGFWSLAGPTAEQLTELRQLALNLVDAVDAAAPAGGSGGGDG